MTATVERDSDIETPDEGQDRTRSPLVPMVAGIALIAIGVVATTYGFFQSVVTDIVAERAQNRLGSDFAVRLEEASTTLDRGEYLAQLEALRIAEAEDPTMQPVSGSFDNPDDVPIMLAQGDPTGLDPLIPDPDLPWVYETPPAHGEPVGRIVIPQAEVDWLFVEGVDVEDLRQGPGHMPNTAMPGQLGNAVISGHRTTYGAPFFNLDRLAPGDRFTVETVIGTHTYQVVESRVVLPTDVWVTSQWEGSWLTLTTCNPRYSSTERLIVFSKLVDGPNAESIAAKYDGDYVVPDPPTG